MVCSDTVRRLMDAVSEERLRRDLFHLAKEPLPFRKLNYTVPGHAQTSLDDADDYIQEQLEAAGHTVDREPVQVQCFRRDGAKPLAHQYSPPMPDDPWYEARNLYARKPGATRPLDIVLVLAHKDSQSWIDSPGANDNAIGTVGVLELARVLAGVELEASVWFLFCNEEHTPWTSAVAAERARERGDRIVAVLNLDGIGVRSPDDVAADRRTVVCGYTEDEGRWLAELVGQASECYGVGLEHRIVRRDFPNDDDGSFVKAGFPASIVVIGSWPYGDPNYHTEADVPELTDVASARLTLQAVLATVCEIAGVRPGEGRGV